jgi:Tol biopolymer transport system component
VASAVNDHVARGRTFAWAPPPVALVAFVDAKGKLLLMNQGGATREVKGVKKPLLPAWSEDGRRLAFVQSSATSNCVVKVVDIR